MLHALIRTWISRRTGINDETRGWLCFLYFDIWIFGVMEVSVRSHEQPRGIFFWAFGSDTLVFLRSSLLSKISEPS